MEELEDFTSVALSEEEVSMKKKGRKRLFTALLLVNIFLAGYIIYSLVMLFINLK